MRQFNRYVLKRYLATLGAVLLIFVALMAIYIVVDELALFLKYGAGLGGIVRFIFFSLPQLVVRFFPLVLLLATIFTVHQMIKWGEMTGAMAAGVSIRQIGAVFAGIGILFGLLQFASNEFAAAWCEDQARKIKAFEIKRKQTSGFAGPSGNFVRGADNRFYHCLFFDRDRRTIHRVQVFQLDDGNQNLKSFLQADSARYEGEDWIFIDGKETFLRSNEVVSATSFDQKRMHLHETADDFADLSLDPRRMSYRKLAAYMQMLSSSGEDPSHHLTELQLKLAFPLSCPIFTLIALVLAFRFKASNLTFELGLAVAFALAFFAMTAALSKMGAREAIPPWIAAWGPAMVFGGLSLPAFFAMRTDYT